MKMLVGTTLLLVPTLLALFTFTTRRHMTLEVAQASEATDRLAGALLSIFAHPELGGPNAHWGRLEHALAALSELDNVRVLAADGRVAYSHAQAGPVPGARHFAGRPCLACHPSPPGGPWEMVRDTPGGTPTLYKVFAVKNGAGCRGCHTEAPPTLGGLLVSARLEDAAHESRLFRRSLGWTIAAALLAVLAAVGLSFHLFVRRPLRHLQEHMGRVEAGELEAPPTPRTRDEVGALYGSFAHMTEELGRTRSQLDQELSLHAGRAHQLAYQLRQTEPRLLRLERVSAVGMLAARVVHEVRTPLNALSLNLQLLRRRIPEPKGDGRELCDLAGLCREEIARINRVLARFLRRAELPPSAVTLVRPGAIAGEVLSLFAAEAQAAGVELALEDPRTLAARPLPADDLRTVLLNLISNALRACEAGGRIEVRVCPGDPGPLRLEVQDTGAGIAETDRARIFDAFFTTAPDGTGLGLAIVRRIVERWGGTISLDTEPGAGTTFALTLPDSEPGRWSG